MDIISKILLKLRQKEVIYNYKKYCKEKIGHALLLYKTAAFADTRLAKQYEHPNHWEVLEMTKILNELGYWVDIVDRGNKDFNPQKKYDIFIGLFQKKKFLDIARKLPSSTLKILYATGANPEINNRNEEARQAYLRERRGVTLELRRKWDPNIQDYIDLSDGIFCQGGRSYAIHSYEKFGKDIYEINASTHPNIGCTVKQLNYPRNPKNFLFFSGNGLMHKGLDLLLEVFSEKRNLNLYIRAPMIEKDFIEEYKNELYSSPNIHVIAYLDLTGDKFYELTSKCAYVVLPSCSEGMATSVLTCMRRGLIPVVTRESGIDSEMGAIFFENDTKEKIAELIDELSKKDEDFIVKKSYEAFINSMDYTQEMFRTTFKKALLKSINNFGVRL